MSIGEYPSADGSLSIGGMECASCDGGRFVKLRSPGMDVVVNQFYNSRFNAVGSCGWHRTLSTDLFLSSTDHFESVELNRPNGVMARYVKDRSGLYLSPANGSSVLVLDPDANLWIEHSGKGIKTAYPFVSSGEKSKAIYIQDAVGNRHVMNYDGKGLLESLTDTVGRKVLFNYNDSALLDTVQDWVGRKTQFGYDTLTLQCKPLLIFITGPTGCKTKFAYDENANLTSIIDPNGIETRYGYNSRGQVISHSAAGAGTTTYEYTSSAQVGSRQFSVVVTDALGNKAVKTYSSDNKLSSTTDSNGVITHTERSNGGLSLANYVMGIQTSSQTFDKRGNLISETDDAGRQTKYTYDDYNNRTSKTSWDGKTTRLIWGYPASPIDTTGERRLLQAVIYPSGHSAEFTYNCYGQRTTVASNGTVLQELTYDNSGNQIETKRRGVIVERAAFDLAGNRVKVVDYTGATDKYDYDARDRVTEKTDAVGNVTRYGYDGNGNKVVEVDPFGNRRSWTYNSWDLIDSETTPLGHTTKHNYDALGRKISITDPLGNSLTTTYNAAGLITTEKDALGRETDFEYDMFGRPTGTIDPLGNRFHNIYDNAGQRIFEVDPYGSKTNFKYDDFGNLVTVVDPAGNVTTIKRDSHGRPIEIADPTGPKAAATYNNRNLLTSISFPNGRQETYEYTYDGLISTLTDQDGKKTNRTYDPGRRLISETDKLGNTTRFEYDPLGNLACVVDANGGRTSTTFDALRRIVRVTDPLGASYDFKYDADGNRVERKDARGYVTTYQYDAAGRQIAVCYPDGNRIDVAFDATGKRISIQDYRGKTCYTYDDCGRLTSETSPTETLTLFTHDALDRRTSITASGIGKTTYGYNATLALQTMIFPYGDGGVLTMPISDGLASICDLVGDEILLEYDAVGNISGKKFAGGMTTTGVFNDKTSTFSISTLNSLNEQILDCLIAYDVNGRPVSVQTGQDGQLQFGYDAIGQVIFEKRIGTTSYQCEYQYDGMGNRTSKKDETGITRYAYNMANALTRIDPPTGQSTSLSYDPNGNLTAISMGDTSIHYEWDYENRLASVTGPGSVMKKYAYNADGQLVAVGKEGVDSHYLRDGANILAETDATGKAIVAYTNTPGQYGEPMSYTHQGQNSLLTFDAASNVRSVNNSSGAEIASYTYDAFGVPISRSDVNNPFQFGGRLGYFTDADTNLVYVRARWYSPAMGRWITRDPIGFQGGDWNLYRYCKNNPVAIQDPSGLACDGECETAQLTVCSETYTLCCNQCNITFGGFPFAGTPASSYCCDGCLGKQHACDCYQEVKCGCEPGSTCEAKYKIMYAKLKSKTVRKKKWHSGHEVYF